MSASFGISADGTPPPATAATMPKYGAKDIRQVPLTDHPFADPRHRADPSLNLGSENASSSMHLWNAGTH